MNINGTRITPAALSVLRGIDAIGITQDGRGGGMRQYHLIGYERLRIYTCLSEAALQSATKQLRSLGLIAARFDVGTKPDSMVRCFELTDAGRKLIDDIAIKSGIDVMRSVVIEAMAAVNSKRNQEYFSHQNFMGCAGDQSRESSIDPEVVA